MRDFAKDREICNAANVARNRIMGIAGQEAHTQEELREMSKCFDVAGKFAKEARIGWLAALDRIAELEAENARLKERLERCNAAKSSMNTTPSLPPTTGANSS